MSFPGLSSKYLLERCTIFLEPWLLFVNFCICSGSEIQGRIEADPKRVTCNEQ